jgi:hypothetical protein
MSRFDLSRDVGSVHYSRCGLFQPTRRPVILATPTTTAWGTASASIALGMQHQDVLEAAQLVADVAVITHEDGRMHLKVSPYLLRVALGGDRVCMWDVRRWLLELKEAKIRLSIPKRKIEFVGAVLDEVITDRGVLNGEAPRRPGIFGRELRRYWRITFSPEWLAVQGDLPTRYHGHLTSITRLRYGATQAAARLMLGHNNPAPRHIASLLRDLGHPRPARGLAAIVSETAALGQMGLQIEGDIISVATASRNLAKKPPAPGMGATAYRKEATGSRKKPPL